MYMKLYILVLGIYYDCICLQNYIFYHLEKLLSIPKERLKIEHDLNTKIMTCKNVRREKLM